MRVATLVATIAYEHLDELGQQLLLLSSSSMGYMRPSTKDRQGD